MLTGYRILLHQGCKAVEVLLGIHHIHTSLLDAGSRCLHIGIGGTHAGGYRAGESVAEAQLNLARLNLSYTVIVATCDGVMGRKDIHEGQLVQPGQMLARIVDDNDVWVVANYRETQMDGITVGKSVDFTADAIPGVVFHGKVEALSAAAGNAYSMIPVDNATGNFVKVEQRVPVRIALTKDNDPKQVALLRAGLNVETKVHIK